MEGITLEELALAARNHGMPLEALRYPVTPVGLHYLLIHYDVPVIEPERVRLVEAGGGLVYEQQRRPHRECAGDRDAHLLSGRKA